MDYVDADAELAGRIRAAMDGLTDQELTDEQVAQAALIFKSGT